jgi:GGDEF domain-containing protein
MLDVNGLKPVNDTYGHEAGDELLQKAAAKIGEVFSGTSASFYRIGGDEFVVLIMGEAEYVSGVEGDGVSIACGVTSYQPGEDAGTAEVLARADKLMYENKRSARA